MKFLTPGQIRQQYDEDRAAIAEEMMTIGDDEADGTHSIASSPPATILNAHNTAERDQAERLRTLRNEARAGVVNKSLFGLAFGIGAGYGGFRWMHSAAMSLANVAGNSEAGFAYGEEYAHKRRLRLRREFPQSCHLLERLGTWGKDIEKYVLQSKIPESARAFVMKCQGRVYKNHAVLFCLGGGMLFSVVGATLGGRDAVDDAMRTNPRRPPPLVMTPYQKRVHDAFVEEEKKHGLYTEINTDRVYLVDPNEQTKVIEPPAPVSLPQNEKPSGKRRQNAPRATDARAQRLQDFFEDPLQKDFTTQGALKKEVPPVNVTLTQSSSTLSSPEQVLPPAQDLSHDHDYANEEETKFKSSAEEEDAFLQSYLDKHAKKTSLGGEGQGHSLLRGGASRVSF